MAIANPANFDAVTGGLLSSFPTVQQVLGAIPANMGTAPPGPNKAGDQTPLPQITNKFTQADVQFPHLFWEMVIRTVWDEGIGMLPIASLPPGTGGQNGIGEQPIPGALSMRQAAKMVRLTSPYGFIAVWWRARRIGAKPFMPTPVPPNENFVFKTSELDTGPPTFNEDSTPLYDWSGRYLFYSFKPPWALDGVVAGFSPVYTPTAQDNCVSSGLFQNFYGDGLGGNAPAPAGQNINKLGGGQAIVA